MTNARYTKLKDHFQSEEDLSHVLPSRHALKAFASSCWFIAVAAFFTGILVMLGGLRLHQNINKHDLDFLRPPGNIKVQFEYNEIYPSPPTMESERAWLNLLPDGIGAVQYDELADDIVTLSVFHQLHCLMAIRHALYDSWNETQHSHMAPHHWRHCLEYLRQSIMCNVDTNIEHRVVRENGVKETPGWDVKRCRNFDATKRWAQEYRAYNGKIPSDKTEIIDPVMLKGRVIAY